VLIGKRRRAKGEGQKAKGKRRRAKGEGKKAKGKRQIINCFLLNKLKRNEVLIN